MKHVALYSCPSVSTHLTNTKFLSCNRELDPYPLPETDCDQIHNNQYSSLTHSLTQDRSFIQGSSPAITLPEQVKQTTHSSPFPLPISTEQPDRQTEHISPASFLTYPSTNPFLKKLSRHHTDTRLNSRTTPRSPLKSQPMSALIQNKTNHRIQIKPRQLVPFPCSR